MHVARFHFPLEKYFAEWLQESFQFLLRVGVSETLLSLKVIHYVMFMSYVKSSAPFLLFNEYVHRVVLHICMLFVALCVCVLMSTVLFSIYSTLFQTHSVSQLAHYAKASTDIEFRYPFGVQV